MSRYENIECPVCRRLFEDGDDIVVCPDCGTPHHRECYNYAGRCVNTGLHSSGFIFRSEPSYEKGIVESAKEAIPQKNETPQPVMPFTAVPELSTLYTADTDTIEGESVGDVAATIRSNIPRFVNVFKKLEKNKRLITWNWGAFFFGSLYYFYRKLYRHAVSLIAAFAALFVGSNLAIEKFAPKCTEIIQEAALSATPQNRMQVSEELMKKLSEASDAKIVVTIFFAFIAAVVILRIGEALLADKIYKKSVCALIKRVKIQIEEGATFSASIPEAENMNLSQEQMRRFYLASKGGVSIFAPAMAFLVLQMLLNFI